MPLRRPTHGAPGDAGQEPEDDVLRAAVDVVPDALGAVLRERDHLLALHEALGELERAPSLERRLSVFADAIHRIGFGRVVITLRDAEMNATAVVAAGLSAEEERDLRDAPVAGAIWQRRMREIERFRISNSFYLEGEDPWVRAEFGGGLPSTQPPSPDSTWSPRDTLLVPLRNAVGSVVAILMLDEPAERARPSLTRVRTVELFGQQVAALLEQAALVDLVQHRAARLQKLHEAGAMIARSLDERTILATLARQLEGLVPVESVALFVTSELETPTARVYRRGGREESPDGVPEVLRSLAVAAADQRRHVAEHDRLAVPGLLGSAVVLVVAVASRSGHALDADDSELLLTIGAQGAVAVSNARLYAESQRQRRQTEALADVARAVGESLHLDRVLNLILRHATALLRTDGAIITMLRRDALEVIAGVGTGERIVGATMPLDGSISGRVVRTASSVIVDEVSDDPDAFTLVIGQAQIRNGVLVPLTSVEGPIGVLAVFNRAAPFSDDDAEILQRLADHTAVAVVNARLYEEVAAATREWAVAFDAIGSGMVLLDAAGCIQRTNARARLLIGVTGEEEVLGRALHQVLFGEDDPCDACVHEAAILRGTPTRGIHEDPKRGRVFEMVASPHPLGGAIVTFDDVTEHHALAERHRRVVETTSEAIVITDRDRRIVFANPAALGLFARGPEVVGTSVTQLVPSDQHDDVRVHEDRALAGDPQQYEGTIVRPDGERRTVSISSAPLSELGVVTGIVASLRDITDERRARDAVTKSEARYRNLFESAGDAIYTLDVFGAFTSVNEATCRLTGRRRDGLLGVLASDLLGDDVTEELAAAFRRAVDGETVRYDCRLQRDDGERLLLVTNTPIRHGAVVVGVLGIARDVTDELARARALERSEASYTRLVESASDAIFTVDGSGRFTAVNRSLERTTGRSRQQLLAESFGDLVDARDLADTGRLLRQTMHGQGSRGSLRFRAGDGEVRQGSLILSPVFDAGSITGALGILRDVTDEQRLAEQLLQQEKLAAVGQLVSGVAHELNNPLAGVMAFSQLLLAAPHTTDEETRRAVETIHREAQRAARIVAHLLTFARQQPAERVATDLNAIIGDSLELRRLALRTAQIEVDLTLDADLPRTWADPFQLQQVVLNLLGNAEHALLDWPGVRRIAIRTTRADDMLVVTLADTGPGIPAEQRDRIFNPFFTTKPVGQGTGLGLSISDGIVRDHGGRIGVESEPGGGARFVVEIPYVEPESRASTAHPARAAAARAHRVLVVDDEPAMRSAISGFLTSLGHTVTVADGGVAARKLLAESEYDAILLDLRMPDLSGDTLFRELLARDPRHAGRVLFVTGDLQSDTARRFLAESGRPAVGKPFQLDDLAAALAAVTG